MNFNLKKSVREASELACSDKNFAVKLLLLYFTKEKILKFEFLQQWNIKAK